MLHCYFHVADEKQSFQKLKKVDQARALDWTCIQVFWFLIQGSLEVNEEVSSLISELEYIAGNF